MLPIFQNVQALTFGIMFVEISQRRYSDDSSSHSKELNIAHLILFLHFAAASAKPRWVSKADSQ